MLVLTAPLPPSSHAQSACMCHVAISFREKERLVAEGEMKASTAVEWEEGFEILGEDGWALLKGLMTFIPSDR